MHTKVKLGLNVKIFSALYYRLKTIPPRRLHKENERITQGTTPFFPEEKELF